MRNRSLFALLFTGTLLLTPAAGPAMAAPAGAATAPTIQATYCCPPRFKVVVQGHAFTPSAPADVFVLGQAGLLAHDVVTTTAQGTFVDKTSVPCAFIPMAAVALDEKSGHWSNLAALPTACPG